ncbi:SCO family protein [uncultured Kordia sp.]|uniref:SCO family protein n=1 Tax=uncultured Kordia sp. TaxID=507699 RepID=UPI0026034534|nr:SCO family protein [uncultured Kordia sp.]
MLSFFRKYRLFAIVMTCLSAIIMITFYFALRKEKVLNVYQPANVNVELVDNSIQHVSKYHKINDFSLVNQNGETITQDTYKGKIYVADFFFTTCQTICPIMTKNMADVQKAILDDDEVMLLSHSVIPEIDTVEQLKKYALEKGVNDAKWNLVTGDKKEIYDLARKSYLAVKSNGDEDYSMVHTENFMLIDKERRIRGFYDGTKKEEIERLLEEIEILKASYDE